MCSKSDFTSYQYATLVRLSSYSDNDITKVHCTYENTASSNPRSKVFQNSIKQYNLLTLLLTVSFVFWNGCLRTANAAPQSCVLCDKEDIESKDPRTNYEEFLFEHQVTRQDAITALKSMNESFYAGPSPENSCKSITCSKKVMKYCLGPQFINDHCWCELGHNDEGLPFVPHICYVGEKVHTASVGSCFFYEEVKDCCCVSALAKQWRHISGSESSHNLPGFLASAAALLTYVYSSHLLKISL